jgi:hypothetical protein
VKQCRSCTNRAARKRKECLSCYGKRRRGTGISEPQPRPKGPRVLLIDIETSPNLVWAWGLWKQNIGINQIVEPTRMLCFAAKWLGEDKVIFRSEHDSSKMVMLIDAWNLLNEADVVVHYYGSRFDRPHLYREFLQEGMEPPSPFRQVDLKLAVAKQFQFPSNKLQFVSQALGFEGKVEHEGFGLWTKCMAGDDEAWARMQEYNEQDVRLLEDVYAALLPWIPGLPNRHLYPDAGSCPACGDGPVERSGLYRTALSTYAQYRCLGCGSWLRSSKREAGASLQQAVLS